MKTVQYYEVYAQSAYGSDVLTFDTWEEALVAAKEWQSETENEIVIVKVEKEWLKWKL